MSLKNIPQQPARLVLEDGSVFAGFAFGDLTPKTTAGEVCFNTSLVGYQEILTDPSYAGQIVTMTYPMIGNYGTNPDDHEGPGPAVKGFVVRELTDVPSNHRSQASLSDWLQSHHITGIQGLDTRALTRKLRIAGALNGLICTQDKRTDNELVNQAKQDGGLVGVNWVKTVSCKEPTQWDQGMGQWASLTGAVTYTGDRHRVVAIDCGAKRNILRHLVQVGCDVTVLPFDATAQQVLEHEPAGLFVSNGPGDPEAVGSTVATLKALVGKLPIFGICLGHQLLSLAMGATTYKLKFGHRGGNQPVQNVLTQKVEITSQNHGFAVSMDSLKKAGLEATHINLNDQTLEGFRHTSEPMFAVQYHPEASPGPHDASYLFNCFVQMMRTGQSPTAQQMHEAQSSQNQQAV